MVWQFTQNICCLLGATILGGSLHLIENNVFDLLCLYVFTIAQRNVCCIILRNLRRKLCDTYNHFLCAGFKVCFGVNLI